jgi:hypothetical protein
MGFAGLRFSEPMKVTLTINAESTEEINVMRAALRKLISRGAKVVDASPVLEPPKSAEEKLRALAGPKLKRR